MTPRPRIPRRLARRLLRRWRYRLSMSDGRVAEVDLVVTTAAAWEASPESRRPGWARARSGPFVLAVSLLI